MKTIYIILAAIFFCSCAEFSNVKTTSLENNKNSIIEGWNCYFGVTPNDYSDNPFVIRARKMNLKERIFEEFYPDIPDFLGNCFNAPIDVSLTPMETYFINKFFADIQ